MRRRSVLRTTHTVEVAQIEEVNSVLSASQLPAITAADLPLEPSPGARHQASDLPGSAVLVRRSWDGSPSFPDIHAHFTTGSTVEAAVVDLHTPALLEIGHRLHLHQIWGIGRPQPAADRH